MRKLLWFVPVVGAAVLYACVGEDPGATGGDVNPDAGSSSGADAPTSDGPSCSTSSTCPATTPTCTNGVCTACDPKQAPSDCATFHASTPKCGPAGACVECVPSGDDAGTSSADCAQKPTTPFCGPTSTCVECLTANHCAPHVCGSDNACRPCQKHAECPAGACGEDGNCVTGSMIAYVDNGGMTRTACAAMRQPINGNTLASAYCDIADAVGQGKPFIVVIGRGAAAPYGPFTVSGTATIIGPGSAMPPAVIGGTLALPAYPNNVPINVSSPGVAPGVTIDGFEVTSTAASADAIHCTTSTAGHVFRLRNSNVHDLHGYAFFNTNCDLVLEDNSFSGTDIRVSEDTINVTPVNYLIQRNVFANGNADGVYVGPTNLIFDRNTVSNFTGGNGLQVNGTGSYRITNSFFFLNRTGVDLNNSSSASHVFQFNTVVFNDTAIGYCPSVVIESSIVRNNGDAPSSLGSCAASHVVADDAGAPAFVNSNDPSKYDFHLAVDTPAHVASNMDCCIDKVPSTFDAGAALPDHDYDGTKRPKGSGYDVGAHEAK